MIVSLTSDFGHKDNAIGITKAWFHHTIPGVQLVDISHDVSPFNLLQCAYLIDSSVKQFPENTIHLSLFDVMHSTPSKILVARAGHQLIISADNGLYSILKSITSPIYTLPTEAYSFTEWIKCTISLIADLFSGKTTINTLATITPAVESKMPKAIINENYIECQIVHIDRFGNVILNITKEEFDAQRKNRSFKINFRRNEYINTISNNYTDVPEKEKLCLFNDAGYLELAINHDSAVNLLGVSLYNPKAINYFNIKIEFQ